jgi:hypothetical protein
LHLDAGCWLFLRTTSGQQNSQEDENNHSDNWMNGNMSSCEVRASSPTS